jgi:hypothetical protein
VVAELLDVHDSKWSRRNWSRSAGPVYDMSRQLRQLVCDAVVLQSKDKWSLTCMLWDRDGRIYVRSYLRARSCASCLLSSGTSTATQSVDISTVLCL